MKNLLPILAGSLVLLVAVTARGMDNGAVCLPYPVNKQYTEECGSCHVAYSPSLLPARSWRKLMTGLESHFDSDASVEESLRVALERHLVEHAMDNEDATCRMEMMSRTLPAREVPLRITQTPYFRRIHGDLRPEVWKHAKVGTPANCGACHSRAAAGRYPEHELRLPMPRQEAFRSGRRAGCMSAT